MKTHNSIQFKRKYTLLTFPITSIFSPNLKKQSVQFIPASSHYLTNLYASRSPIVLTRSSNQCRGDFSFFFLFIFYYILLLLLLFTTLDEIDTIFTNFIAFQRAIPRMIHAKIDYQDSSKRASLADIKKKFPDQ